MVCAFPKLVKLTSVLAVTTFVAAGMHIAHAFILAGMCATICFLFKRGVLYFPSHNVGKAQQHVPRLPKDLNTTGVQLTHRGKMPGATADKEAAYEDPFRWSFIPSQGTNRSHRVYEQNTELCYLKIYIMDRPVHDPKKDAAGEYPSSWHFAGRNRQWEIRMQLRFKRLPKGPLFFGLEYTTYQPMSAFVRSAESILIAAVSRVMGAVYKSPGDDPALMGGTEAEPACAVVPAYAFDQLIVSDVGKEPDIASSFEKLGWLRADGISVFKRMVETTLLGSPSTEKVYTLCTWSVSPFIDIVNWKVKIPGGLRLDGTRLTGAPPLILTVYELDDRWVDQQQGDRQDKRHLISRKHYYVRFAYWSTACPPESNHLRNVLRIPSDAQRLDDSMETKHASAKIDRAWQWSSDLFCCAASRGSVKQNLS